MWKKSSPPYSSLRPHYPGSLRAVNQVARTPLPRRARHQAEQRGKRQGNDKRNERRAVTPGGVMHKTEERRARRAEGVGDENSQAAHRAEREPSEISRPDDLLQHPTATQSNPVQEKTDVQKRHFARRDGHAEPGGLNDKHQHARMANLHALA